MWDITPAVTHSALDIATEKKARLVAMQKKVNEAHGGANGINLRMEHHKSWEDTVNRDSDLSDGVEAESDKSETARRDAALARIQEKGTATRRNSLTRRDTKPPASATNPFDASSSASSVGSASSATLDDPVRPHRKSLSRITPPAPPPSAAVPNLEEKYKAQVDAATKPLAKPRRKSLSRANAPANPPVNTPVNTPVNAPANAPANAPPPAPAPAPPPAPPSAPAPRRNSLSRISPPSFNTSTAPTSSNLPLKYMNYGSISPPPPPFPLLPFSSTASTSQNKRYVLLENLSTSSTLLLFLLPYIFLLLSSYLDASASFSTTSYALPPPIPPPSSSPFTYSAVITSLPPLSTFLRADAVFTNLSSPLLAALSDRQISYSLLVSSPPSLAPLYATNPAPLPIVCNTPSHCSSPRLLDILFSAPNSAILSSSTVAVSIAYSPTNSSHPIPDLLTLLYEAASYSVQHESKSYDAFLSSTRFLLFLFTLVFAYVYSSQTFPNGSHVPFFSPSTLVPERRYVFILLCSLLLLINPVQIIVHHYGLYTPTLLFFSDLVTNAGIHGFLFSFLCIFSGLKHHTAASLQKRASQQRAIKLLRETQEHLQVSRGLAELSVQSEARERRLA